MEMQHLHPDGWKTALSGRQAGFSENLRREEEQGKLSLLSLALQ